MARFTLFVDPGLRSCGVALFEGTRLYKAWLSRNTMSKIRGNEAWDSMANAVVKDWIRRTRRRGQLLYLLGCEVPQIYRGSKARPDDLIQLAGVVGAVSAAVPANRRISYYPREWKGQVPKDVHNRRILEKLGADEKRAIEFAGAATHNVNDAVGQALWYHGRLGR